MQTASRNNYPANPFELLINDRVGASAAFGASPLPSLAGYFPVDMRSNFEYNSQRLLQGIFDFPAEQPSSRLNRKCGRRAIGRWYRRYFRMCEWALSN
jgi:hypothetical protein